MFIFNKDFNPEVAGSVDFNPKAAGTVKPKAEKKPSRPQSTEGFDPEAAGIVREDVILTLDKKMKHLNNGLLQKLNTLSKKKDIASAKETIALAKQIKAYSGSIKNFIGENYDDLVKRIPEQKLQAIIQYTDTKSGEMDVYIVKTKEAIDTAQTKVVQKTEPKKEDPAEAAPTAEQNTAVSQAKKETHQD
jgi:hypothetical protein